MTDGFDDWFYELEGYHFRAERFWDDFASQDPKLVLEWLRTAYEIGYAEGQRVYGGTE